jgi:uncharacterized protein YneF (UPF0154 family)
MKVRFKYFILVGVFIALFFSVGGYFINKTYNEYVKSQPQMYCYQTFYGPANPVLIIESLSYSDEYIDYYSNAENKRNMVIKFPLKTMPVRTPVYVINYTSDSLLAEIVSYYDRGPSFGGSFTKGWVYAKTLHENPPIKTDL